MIFPFPSINKCTQFDFLNSYIYCFAFFFRLFLFLHIFGFFSFYFLMMCTYLYDSRAPILFYFIYFFFIPYSWAGFLYRWVFNWIDFSFYPHKIYSFFLSSISFSIIFIYYSKGSSSIATQYPSFQALIFVFLILVKPYSIWNWNDVQKKKIEIVLQLVRCVYNIK